MKLFNDPGAQYTIIKKRLPFPISIKTDSNSTAVGNRNSSIAHCSILQDHMELNYEYLSICQ